MSEPSEVQIITMPPIKASVGGVIVEIPILRAGKAIEWKKEWEIAIASYQGKVFKPDELKKANASENDVLVAFYDMVKEMLVGAQEKVTTLVCSYADKSGGAITSEKILAEAWDAEIAVLWEKMVEETFIPLATSLASTMTPKKK